MKKRYKSRQIWTAPTAPPKWRTAIKKIDGVNDATVSFMTQKLTHGRRRRPL